jgi:hypothetical protein
MARYRPIDPVSSWVRKELVGVGTRGGDVEMEGDAADGKERRGIGRDLDGARAEIQGTSSL